MPDDIPQYEFSPEEELHQRMERAKARDRLNQATATTLMQTKRNALLAQRAPSQLNASPMVCGAHQ
jgi:hypothetical protein